MGSLAEASQSFKERLSDLRDAVDFTEANEWSDSTSNGCTAEVVGVSVGMAKAAASLTTA